MQSSSQLCRTPRQLYLSWSLDALTWICLLQPQHAAVPSCMLPYSVNVAPSHLVEGAFSTMEHVPILGQLSGVLGNVSEKAEACLLKAGKWVQLAT